MQATKRFWDKVAAKYAKAPIGDMDAYRYTLERTRSYIHPTDTILELGCGTGSTALELARGAGRIVASDISPEMLKIGAAKARAAGIENLQFHEAEAGAAIPGGPFDVVLAFNLLHLLEQPEQSFRMIHAGLKPGGLFISKTICLPSRGISVKLNLVRAILPVMRLLGRAPYVRITRIEALERMIAGAGFEIIETGNHPAHPPRRYIVARKAS